ncbi:P-loop containing nucleoside triphosphate hydrolase protein [Paraphysoderma sedebokerense]|nr:P-loop containing nucleoside triphosphate hydrolase protein [Paraphysoderma sedebokerense]
MTTVLNSKRTRDSSEWRQEIKKQKKSQQKGRSLLDQRQQLPIYEAKQTILDLIKDNQVTVIEGETGSGKTTQIPQFLYESGYAKSGIIGITQPRRVAALSLAQRVSDELNVKLALIDPMLRKYSVIVLDEAHERTLRTDILFGIVKRLIHQRNDLKVIVMSATLDTDKFSSFFNGAKILKIPGRLHGVSVFHTESPQQDYLHSSLMAVFQIHREGAPGDILCFLTGQEDIESLTVLITEFSKQLAPTQEQLLVCPIFANLPASQQSQVFKPAPKGYRKVVLATNIAETSITISGISNIPVFCSSKNGPRWPRGRRALLPPVHRKGLRGIAKKFCSRN